MDYFFCSFFFFFLHDHHGWLGLYHISSSSSPAAAAAAAIMASKRSKPSSHNNGQPKAKRVRHTSRAEVEAEAAASGEDESPRRVSPERDDDEKDAVAEAWDHVKQDLMDEEPRGPPPASSASPAKAAAAPTHAAAAAATTSAPQVPLQAPAAPAAAGAVHHATTTTTTTTSDSQAVVVAGAASVPTVAALRDECMGPDNHILCYKKKGIPYWSQFAEFKVEIVPGEETAEGSGEFGPDTYELVVCGFKNIDFKLRDKSPWMQNKMTKGRLLFESPFTQVFSSVMYWNKMDPPRQGSLGMFDWCNKMNTPDAAKDLLKAIQSATLTEEAYAVGGNQRPINRLGMNAEVALFESWMLLVKRGVAQWFLREQAVLEPLRNILRLQFYEQQGIDMRTRKYMDPKRAKEAPPLDAIEADIEKEVVTIVEKRMRDPVGRMKKKENEVLVGYHPQRSFNVKTNLFIDESKHPVRKPIEKLPATSVIRTDKSGFLAQLYHNGTVFQDVALMDLSKPEGKRLVPFEERHLHAGAIVSITVKPKIYCMVSNLTEISMGVKLVPEIVSVLQPGSKHTADPLEMYNDGEYGTFENAVPLENEEEKPLRVCDSMQNAFLIESAPQASSASNRGGGAPAAIMAPRGAYGSSIGFNSLD
jgi:hypothetical protein